MTNYDKIYVNGQWVPSEGTKTIAVHDSITEEVMATIPEGTAGDVAKAAAAAKAAFESWSALPAAERAKYMSRIGDALGGRGWRPAGPDRGGVAPVDDRARGDRRSPEDDPWQVPVARG